MEPAGFSLREPGRAYPTRVSPGLEAADDRVLLQLGLERVVG